MTILFGTTMWATTTDRVLISSDYGATWRSP